MRRALLIAVTLALSGCDDTPRAPDEQAWKQSMTECRAKTEKSQDADYILACMEAAGYEPLDADDAPDICFSQHIFDTPGCWIKPGLTRKTHGALAVNVAKLPGLLTTARRLE